MSTDRDVERIVRSWMDEGVTALPDRVLDLVLDQVPATPQRRAPWLARRFSHMNSPMRILLAGAAVVAVLLVGYNLFGGGPSIGTDPTASPEPSPSPTAPPAVTILGASTSPRTLTAGTYRVADPFPLSFELTLPAGWTNDKFLEGEVAFTANGPYIGFFAVESVFIDPCHPEAGMQVTRDGPLSWPTDRELVTALRSLVDFKAGPISALGIGSRPAQQFSISNTIDTSTAGCTNAELLPLFVPLAGQEASTNGGTTLEVWVVDVNNSIGAIKPQDLVIVAEVSADSAAADQALIDEVIASLNFDWY